MIGYVEAARLQHMYTKGSPMLELQMFLVCLFVCLFVCCTQPWKSCSPTHLLALDTFATCITKTTPWGAD